MTGQWGQTNEIRTERITEIITTHFLCDRLSYRTFPAPSLSSVARCELDREQVGVFEDDAQTNWFADMQRHCRRFVPLHDSIEFVADQFAAVGQRVTGQRFAIRVLQFKSHAATSRGREVRPQRIAGKCERLGEQFAANGSGSHRGEAVQTQAIATQMRGRFRSVRPR